MDCVRIFEGRDTPSIIRKVVGQSGDQTPLDRVGIFQGRDTRGVRGCVGIKDRDTRSIIRKVVGQSGDQPRLDCVRIFEGRDTPSIIRKVVGQSGDQTPLDRVGIFQYLYSRNIRIEVRPDIHVRSFKVRNSRDIRCSVTRESDTCECSSVTVITSTCTDRHVVLNMQLTEDVHVDFVRRIVRYIGRFKCVLCVSDRECICSSVVYEGDIRSGALHENTHVSRRDRVIIGYSYDRIID